MCSDRYDLGCDIKTKNFGFLGFGTKKILTKKLVTKKTKNFFLGLLKVFSISENLYEAKHQKLKGSAIFQSEIG